MKNDMNGANAPRFSLKPADLRRVSLTDGFWAAWQKTNREVTIPYVLDQCDKHDRTRSLRLEWKPGADWEPHQFYDSDIAKALEAVAFSLQTHPDPALEARLAEYVSLFARAQQSDGYLNSYYTQIGLDKRWSNLRDMHELYCAGHLFEAAVAHFDATGSRDLLDVAVRYADHIDARFGPTDEPSPNDGTKAPGYPGHEEIELALIKLARATGEPRYERLAAFFVNERGSQPHYFTAEAERRSEPPKSSRWVSDDFPAPYAYFQAHLPVREQTAAEGHSVRACYLYAGMADVARETGDAALLDACRRLFENIVDRRMYVTGGVGSHSHGERFTVDYDLPNEAAYAETCAAISLVFFASRMANIELDSRYADVAERAMYNGVLAGLSLSGDRFFYANPLSFHPTSPVLHHVRSDAERQPWYGCACCPPNIARLVASLGSYVYGVADDTIAVHLYAASTLEFDIGGSTGSLTQKTAYPWDGEVEFTVELSAPETFTLALRIPAWADGWTIDGADVRDVEKGYAYITRRWQSGDRVRLSLPMAPRRAYAHPSVRQDGWKVAIEYGPVVYCLEGVDNGADLAQFALPADAELRSEFRADLLGGCTVITGTGLRRAPEAPADDSRALYRPSSRRTPTPFTAIPYALWNNRGSSEMRVWLAEV